MAGRLLPPPAQLDVVLLPPTFNGPEPPPLLCRAEAFPTPGGDSALCALRRRGNGDGGGPAPTAAAALPRCRLW